MTNSDSSEHHNEYGDDFVAGLEWIWGDGFLSPGGADEVARILRGVDLRGRQVLDIGCGIGGIDILLVKTYGAGRVVAIDVEEPLLEKARAAALAAGIAEHIDFQLVTPSPLPFPDASFEAVFSKDAMIHIPDKQAIYAEIYRVLKPGGRLAVSDWFGSDKPQTAEFKAWLDIVGLTFKMETIDNAAAMLAAAGFSDIESEDRNAWYRQEARRELAAVSGDSYARLAAHIGESAAVQRLRSSSAKLAPVDQGQLRPGHLRARKPA